MTRQEIFDKVVAGLANQDWIPSINESKDGSYIGCRYRGPEGRRCAVGHLIPDAAYGPFMEGSSVKDSPIDSLLWRALQDVGISYADRDFLGKLQVSHDREYRNSDHRMRDDIRDVGQFHNLTLPDVLQSPSTDSKQA